MLVAALLSLASQTAIAEQTAEAKSAALASGISINDVSLDDIMTIAPNDLGNTRRPLGPNTAPKPTSAQINADRVAAITGGKGVIGPGAINDDAANSYEKAAETAGRKEQKYRDGTTFFDRLGAVIEETNILPAIMRTLDEEATAVDPEFGLFYMKNWKELENFAETQDEVDQIRGATSREDLRAIVGKITTSRENNRIINSNGTGYLFRLLPAGILFALLLLVVVFIVVMRRTILASRR